MGFYAAGPFLGLLSAYAALRSRTAPAPAWWVVLSGVAAGLAVWCSVCTVFLLVPAAAWALRGVRAAVVWLAATALGAAVVIEQWLRVGQLPLPPVVGPTSPPERRVLDLAGPVLREFVGVAHPYGRGGLPRPAQWLVVGALAVVYLVAVARFVIRFTGGGRVSVRPVDVLLLTPVVAVLAFALSPNGAYVGTPRYLLAAYPLYAIGLAAVLPRRDRDAVRVGGLLLVVTAAVTVPYLLGPALTESRPPRGDVAAAVRLLERRGVTTVYADYWTAMPLEYASGQRVHAAAYGGAERFPSDQRLADANPVVTYVASTADSGYAQLRAALDAAGLTGSTQRVGVLVVVGGLPGWARPDALHFPADLAP